MHIRILNATLMFLSLVLCWSLGSSVANAEKNTYYAKLDLGNIKVNLGIVNTYEKRLSKALKRNVKISTKPDLNYDIWISSESVLSQNDENKWTRSGYSLDFIPTFIEVSLKDPKTSSGIIGQTQGFYQLASTGRMQRIEDAIAATRLLEKGQIDKVISHSNNAQDFLSNKSLKIQELNNSTALFVSFKSDDLLQRYNNHLSTVNLTDTLDVKTLEPTATTNDNTVIWQLFFKSFDDNLNKLVLLDEDKKATEWYQGQMPNFKFVLAHGTIADGFNAMREHNNLCILNIFKTEERNAFAHFTAPSVAYMNERIYAIEGSQFNKQLSELSEQQAIKLDELSATSKLAKIGFDYRYFRRFPNSIVDLIKKKDTQFENTQKSSKSELVSHLRQGKIESFIDLPSRLRQPLTQQYNKQVLTSYGIHGIAPSRNGYIACSKTPVGQAVVEQVNQLLNNEENRLALADIYAKHFDKKTKVVAKKAFIALAGQK